MSAGVTLDTGEFSPDPHGGRVGFYGALDGSREPGNSPRFVERAHAASSERSAACAVLARSMAIVIGPTPPGTGVIAAAISRTASKSTSPQSRYPRGRVASSTRVVP